MIERTRLSLLGVLALVGFAAGWVVVSLLETNGVFVPVSASGLAVWVALALIVPVAAWPLRRLQRGDLSKRIPPLRAARIFALSRAGSRVGALGAGWFLGHAAMLFPDLGVEPRRERLIWALVTAAIAALGAVTSYVAEGWCEVRDDDRNSSKSPDAPTESPS